MPNQTQTLDPVDALLHHVADKITPLFVTPGTDTAFARKAALSALAAYHPESRADIVNIARILAFSLASLVALGLAAADDLTPAQKIRFFGRANALNRSADQTERMMMQRRRDQRTNPPVEITANLDPLPAAPINHDAALDALVDEAMTAYRATLREKPGAKADLRSVPPQSDRTAAVLQAAVPTQRPAAPYKQTLLNGSAMPQINGAKSPPSYTHPSP